MLQFTTFDTKHVVVREVGHALALYHYWAPLHRLVIKAEEQGLPLACTELDGDALQIAITCLGPRTSDMTPYIKVMGVARVEAKFAYQQIGRGNPESASAGEERVPDLAASDFCRI